MNKRNEKLTELWDEIAPFYSKAGPNYWGCFGERLVELSSIKENGDILDIGTGRGAVLFPVSFKAGSLAHVIGIDFSKNMVDMTNDEIKMNNITNAEVLLMDMKEADFEDEYFDNIISGFSMGCVLGNDVYMQNVIRMLKKGGQLSFTMWGKQKDQEWLTDIVNQYIKPVESKRESNAINLNSTECIRMILENVNLKKIKIIEEEKEVIYLDKHEWWWEMKNNAVRNVFKSIEKLGQAKFNEFSEQVNNALECFKKENGICFKMNVIYVAAEK